MYARGNARSPPPPGSVASGQSEPKPPHCGRRQSRDCRASTCSRSDASLLRTASIRASERPHTHLRSGRLGADDGGLPRDRCRRCPHRCPLVASMSTWRSRYRVSTGAATIPRSKPLARAAGNRTHAGTKPYRRFTTARARMLVSTRARAKHLLVASCEPRPSRNPLHIAKRGFRPFSVHQFHIGRISVATPVH